MGNSYQTLRRRVSSSKNSKQQQLVKKHFWPMDHPPYPKPRYVDHILDDLIEAQYTQGPPGGGGSVRTGGAKVSQPLCRLARHSYSYQPPKVPKPVKKSGKTTTARRSRPRKLTAVQRAAMARDH